MPNIPNPETNQNIGAAANKVGSILTATGLTSVGSGANPPTAFPDLSKGAAAGLWGFVGPVLEAPSQTSSPPSNCGVCGQADIPNAVGVGVLGVSSGGIGVSGTSTGDGQGVSGTSTGGIGVEGSSTSGDGVFGYSANGCGVHGTGGASNPNGAAGGVEPPTNGCGVLGDTYDCTAVFGASVESHGVHGANGLGSGTTPSQGCGVWGESESGYGVYGSSKTGNAGQFDGNVTVTGEVHAKDVIVTGGDCAEEFDLANPELQPGSVVVLTDIGAVDHTTDAYNTRVAGVISGAGSYSPGIILDRQCSIRRRAPVALVGKVFCKVDSSYAPIVVGDLLTTSPTAGCAMKVTSSERAVGAVIGKALASHRGGRGLIPMLVTLR